MKSRYLLSALLLSSCLVAPCVAAAQDTGEVDEIVITGQRATDRDSLEKKREATSASEIVSGGEAGKLPDQNVAESVRRLSGVSVATDKGEGRYLIIRGIEPNLANVTINSQTASAPEPESRNVKLDDIPSALIGSVQVVKSLTPDLDANAIAGQVDIKTVTAFDRNRNFFSARGGVGGFEITDEQAYEADISGGALFGPDKQFGVVVALNWSERPSDSEDVLSGGYQEPGPQTVQEAPVEFDNRVYTPALRTRTGAVVNLDWRPNDDVKAYARLMYSKFDDNEERNRTRIFLPTSFAAYGGTLTDDGGTFTTGASARKLIRVRNEITDTTTFAVGGEFNIGESLLTIQATHNIATKEDPIRDEIEYRYNNGDAGGGAIGQITGTFERSDGSPGRLTVSQNAYNPAFYRLRNFKQVSREAEEKLNQFRIDYQMPIGVLGDDSYLKFGAKWLDRDKYTDATGEVFTYAGPTNSLVGETGRTYPNTFNGRIPAGPSISYDAVNALFKANPGQWTSDPEDQIIETLGSDYQVQETITSAYVMANLDFGAISIIPGVRVEQTEGDTKAIAVTPTSTINDTFNRFGSYSYTDVFPGLNLKWEVNENMLVRAAITTAIGRPEYFQLAPTVESDGDNVALGNPDLKPQEAVNLDASLEYYFSDEGGFSIGVFHKQIENPIFATTLVNQTGVFGGVAITDGDVSTYVNGTEAEVSGLELNFQKPLTFLPGALDGFGVNLNATFLNGKLTVPGRTKQTSLPKQSDMLLSAQVYYEKYGFSARVAYTYRSAYIDELGGEAKDDLYFDENATLGIKVGYKFPIGLEVFAEGNNLNDETDFYYYGNRSRFAEAETYGPSWRIGLSYTY